LIVSPFLSGRKDLYRSCSEFRSESAGIQSDSGPFPSHGWAASLSLPPDIRRQDWLPRALVADIDFQLKGQADLHSLRHHDLLLITMKTQFRGGVWDYGHVGGQVIDGFTVGEVSCSWSQWTEENAEERGAHDSKWWRRRPAQPLWWPGGTNSFLFQSSLLDSIEPASVC
jgi:hypothetical protein